MATTAPRFRKRILAVFQDFHASHLVNEHYEDLADHLRRFGIEIVLSDTLDEARRIISSDMGLQGLILHISTDSDQQQSTTFLQNVKELNPGLPLFLASETADAGALDGPLLTVADDFIWLFEDTSSFIAGRVNHAVENYRAHILPPMFRAMIEFDNTHEYSWHTPGHTGGTGFLKSPPGLALFEFFGEQCFRSDLSISVGELGSLLDHSGPIGEAEKHAAGVFGADRTYFVTNGSSTSNRVILMSSVTRGQIALCDRNCHKSVEHAMTMSGASPVYLRPSRNGLGIIGPIPPAALQADAIARAIADNPVLPDGIDPVPVHAIITNSTYDGLCYNVSAIEKILGDSVDRLHFDEAWYGYARFNPLYRGRFGMHDIAPDDPGNRPTVFTTQSTHKLLAAFSQASMIHIRDGRRPVEHARFNEAFMMHASTSPLYQVIASCDVSAAMMKHNGRQMTDESIREAVAFRQKLARLKRDAEQAGDWHFTCWQPEEVTFSDGTRAEFCDADPDRLSHDQSCWVLDPQASWHGFDGLEPDWAMLDPIKVSILSPGIAPNGTLADAGIPAAIVSRYLGERAVVVEKTTDFTILLLFSIGITKGKWGTLLNALGDFKADYDANRPLSDVLRSLSDSHPERYTGMGLRDLCDEMFATVKELQTTRLMAQGFAALPTPELAPVDAYEELVRNNVERIRVQDMGGRVVATGIVPYPPGIPLLMPGENAGPADGPLVGYLKSLAAFDERFPGFEHDTHGIEVEDGEHWLLALKRSP